MFLDDSKPLLLGGSILCSGSFVYCPQRASIPFADPSTSDSEPRG